MLFFDLFFTVFFLANLHITETLDEKVSEKVSGVLKKNNSYEGKLHHSVKERLEF